MERYTVRQVNRALAQEQLLKRLEAGEDFEELCRILNLSHSQDYLPELRRRYQQGGSSWEALIDHRHGHAAKVTPARQAWLRQQKQEHPALTQQALAERFEAEFGVTLSQSQISNVLRATGVAQPGGQRYRSEGKRALPVERAGVFFPSGGGAPDGGPQPRDPSRVGAAKALPGG